MRRHARSPCASLRLPPSMLLLYSGPFIRCQTTREAGRAPASRALDERSVLPVSPAVPLAVRMAVRMAVALAVPLAIALAVVPLAVQAALAGSAAGGRSDRVHRPCGRPR